MSSASSGRYQSRLFNFVHQQSRRLTQQCDRAFRHLQVSAGWAASVGLYPLLLMFRSTRSSAKQLHQTVKHSFPQLSADDIDIQTETPPSVDTPIQRVLLLVAALSSKEAVLTPLPENTKSVNNPLKSLVTVLGRLKIFSYHSVGIEDRRQGGLGGPITYHSLTTDNSLLTTHSIRGIATQLSSRTLVLVTAQNQILDLTSWQQQKLQQRIVAVVADYWRYQRLACSIGLGTQLSAIGAQASQESKEASYLSIRRSPSSPDLHPMLAFLDRTIAKVESNPLMSVAAKNSFTASRFAHALGSMQPLQRIGTGLAISLFRDKSSAINPEVSSETYKKIQALIWTAINYFFGASGRQHLEQTESKIDSYQSRARQNLVSIPGLPLNPPLRPTSLHSQENRLPQRRSAAKFSLAQPICRQSVEPNLEDPWLSESDLFGDSVAAGAANQYQSQSKPRIRSETRKTSLALPSEQAAGYSLQNFVNHLRKFLRQAKPASDIVKQQRINKGNAIAKGSTKPSRPVFKSPQQAKAGEISAQASAQNTQMQPTPDWIETNATVMGYVKHPLEQLLQWLDRAMLWLEEVSIKLWKWVQQLWQGQGK